MSLNFDSKFLVTAGKDRMIKIWDTNSNKLISTLKVFLILKIKLKINFYYILRVIEIP